MCARMLLNVAVLPTRLDYRTNIPVAFYSWFSNIKHTQTCTLSCSEVSSPQYSPQHFTLYSLVDLLTWTLSTFHLKAHRHGAINARILFVHKCLPLCMACYSFIKVFEMYDVAQTKFPNDRMAANHSNRCSLNRESETVATEPFSDMYAQNCNNFNNFTLVEYTFDNCIGKYLQHPN